ncbi:MAG TPA: hypothetical protein VMM59_06830 [Thermohalobaculum sp.]|nr:hypothetical protein [Thermohalobaculum sp.]
MKTTMKTTTFTVAAALAISALALPARADVTHQCSGIGMEERAEAENVPHTLRLVYAQPNGNYLGSIETRIAGPQGELVNVRCPGPWVLVDLPDGTYQVTASFKGETKSRRVTIAGGRQQRQVFVF